MSAETQAPTVQPEAQAGVNPAATEESARSTTEAGVNPATTELAAVEEAGVNPAATQVESTRDTTEAEAEAGVTPATELAAVAEAGVNPAAPVGSAQPGGPAAIEAPPLWKAWVISARPQTLTACAAPVVVGSALAAAGPGWRPELALVALLAAGGIQIGTNFVNDAADAATGADDGERIGPPRAVARGWLSARAVWIGAALSFLVSLALGGILIATSGWPLLVIGLTSIAAGYAYTTGPFPLAYLGLGDLFVILFFGEVATLGTYYVHTGALSWPVALAGLGLGLLATAILVANNLRDRVGDARANKRTLVVRFGERFGRREYAACVLVPFALLPLPPLLGVGGWGWLLPLLILPWALLSARAVLARRRADEPGEGDYRVDGVELIPRLVEAARMQLVYSLLLALGVSL